MIKKILIISLIIFLPFAQNAIAESKLVLLFNLIKYKLKITCS